MRPDDLPGSLALFIGKLEDFLVQLDIVEEAEKEVDIVVKNIIGIQRSWDVDEISV